MSNLTGLGVDQLRAVVREQTERAMRETIGRMPQFGARAKLNATAALLGLYGGGAVVAAVILLLALALPDWVAAVLVGIVLLVAAAVVRAQAKAKTSGAAADPADPDRYSNPLG
ncbi:phage holin family protein [Nocardia yamanashiensis]|uniref:phage holin family protein n=1 Tax=Nocardia yamanashiensis TaxID=209247 RepID=UPI001E29E6BC|nr:phage holin family protein [Nocardia yamanashiensis]UGT44784.1 phage holin family protein [Nocardia yamanashiensis]